MQLPVSAGACGGVVPILLSFQCLHVDVDFLFVRQMRTEGFSTCAPVAFCCGAGLPSLQHTPTLLPGEICQLPPSQEPASCILRSSGRFFHLCDASGVIGRKKGRTQKCRRCSPFSGLPSTGALLRAIYVVRFSHGRADQHLVRVSDANGKLLFHRNFCRVSSCSFVSCRVVLGILDVDRTHTHYL